jgi:hypothetical protein
MFHFCIMHNLSTFLDQPTRILGPCLEWRHDTLHNDIQHNDTQHEGLICDTHHKWNVSQHNNALLLYWVSLHWVSHFITSMVNVIMLSVAMLNVIKLRVVMPNVVRLSVLALFGTPHFLNNLLMRLISLRFTLYEVRMARQGQTI